MIATNKNCVWTSPKAAPPYIVLAEILKLGSLNDQLINLIFNKKLFVRLEITTREFLGDPVKHFDSPRILHLRNLDGAMDTVIGYAWERRGG